jgi:hypothetical protein
MNTSYQTLLTSKGKSFLSILLATITLSTISAQAQCPATVLTSGLRAPVKLILAPRGDLVVAETGNGPNSGRISIVNAYSGHRKTLLDGLPSGFAQPNGDSSGPSGLFLRGRTLYLSIGGGDSTLAGAVPGSEIVNPNPSSPILSSVLAIRLRERGKFPDRGAGLTLTDHFALKNGSEVTKGHGDDKITIRLVTDFPNTMPLPRPGEPNAVKPSSPFGLVINDDEIYVADASMNIVREVDIDTGAVRTLTSFAPLPNTRGFGPPVSEAVPDSIHLFEDQLLVTLLSGFPFSIGGAQVRTVDPETGANASFITGLTSAIDVLPVRVSRCLTSFLTLEYSADQLIPGMPGRIRHFASPAATPSVVADCLITPTSIVRDGRSEIIYVTENSTGRIMKISQ